MTCLVLCRKESCSTMRYIILAGVFCFLYVPNSSLHIDMRKMGLLAVPQNINVFVKSLNLDFNNINQITKESFSLYTDNLSILIQYNHLSYIKDGSFDHNAKLEILNIAVNTIKQLPNSFGAAAKSLRKLSIYNALLEPAISNLNLTDLIKLKDFRAGWANWNGKFDPSLLPCNLKLIGIPGVFLTEFPDFGSCTPNISTIGVGKNTIIEIPRKFIAENFALKKVDLSANQLSNIPDLFHLPLADLDLSGNPLVCNQSLCWIRMWPWAKTSQLMTDDITRETQEARQQIPLTEINPITLGCQDVMFIEYIYYFRQQKFSTENIYKTVLSLW